MNVEKENLDRDPLDDWLAAARWPEPSAESDRRLREGWRRLRDRHHQVLAMLAAAAVMALAVGVSWVALRKPPAAVVRRPPQVLPERAPVLAGRPPTLLESMMIQAAEARERRSSGPAVRTARAKLEPPAAPPVVIHAAQPAPDPIVELINQPDRLALQRYLELVADRDTRASALAALDRVSSPPTERVIDALRDPRIEIRKAAALTLGRIDGPVLTRRLIGMVAADQNRREALLALTVSRGAAARAFVQQATQTPALSALARSTLIQQQQNEVQ